MLTSHKGNRGAFSFQINEIMTNAKNGCSGVVTSAKKKKKDITQRHLQSMNQTTQRPDNPLID